MKIRTVHRNTEHPGFDRIFLCPACECGHGISLREPGPVWTLEGTDDKPTIKPSVKIEIGHRGDNGEQVITSCCHSVVTDGMIHFEGDCTHAMANQTVPLPDF